MKLKPTDRLVVTIDGGATVLLMVRESTTDRLMLSDEDGQQRIEVRRLVVIAQPTDAN